VAANSEPVVIRRHKKQQAVVFIHGFSGSAHLTFGMFPAFLAGDPALFDWDIYSFGYATSLSPDLTGVWTSDPDLTALSGLLRTFVTHGALADYQKVALIAHSMGGLIVQRALVDGGFESRIQSVMLFGTPSNGLKKAFFGQFFKPQAKDMLAGGKFVTSLRNDWNDKFGKSRSFHFWTVAGTRDQFVPESSSVDVFPDAIRQRVDGNHLEIVKPESAGSDNVLLVVRTLTAGATPVPKPAARAGLPRETVTAALALELQKGTQEALDYLLSAPDRETNTDVMGAIAGRLKRLWLSDKTGNSKAGHQALSWYRKGLDRSTAAGDHAQASYHGINVAFLQLALQNDPAEARKTAARVLKHCAAAPDGLWRQATEGEAHLYRNDIEPAVEHYRRALELNPRSRDVDSMYQQAIWASRMMENPEAEAALNEVFGTRH
jgi:pimeloyl-ACP methyl ester carboxylesterase